MKIQWEDYFLTATCINFVEKICVVTKITNLVLDEYFLSIDDEEVSWYFNNAMLLPANSLRYLVMTREATS